MLKEVDVVTNPGALNDPTIDELSAQCAQMRPRVVALVQSVSDEALMMKALSLNDELTEVAEKRDALKAAASADRDTRAAIVASMREEEVAAERHGSGAGAGSNAVGDLVDLLGGDSFVVEDPPRPGKDKKGVEGHAGGVVDPFDVSVSVGNGVGGGAGGGRGELTRWMSCWRRRRRWGSRRTTLSRRRLPRPCSRPRSRTTTRRCPTTPARSSIRSRPA